MMLESQFKVSAPEVPVLAVWRGSSLRSLGGDGLLFCGRDPLSTGQTIGLFGAGLPARRSLLLGIYGYDAATSSYPLVSGQRVTTDAEGTFAALVVLDASYASGGYLAAVFVDPAHQPSFGGDPSGAIACFRIGED
jgi:hypothetical protein